MISLKRTCLLLIIIVFVLSAFIQTAIGFQAYPRTELTDKVDELFTRYDRNDGPGLALGIIKDGSIIYARGYGMANLEYDIPNTPQTVFRTGSLAKQFTAMCIAILADQGKLSVEDDIRKYIPEMPVYEAPVLITHLIRHTSGVRDYLTLQSLALKSDADYYTNQEVLDIITWQNELNFVPGSQYLYSNSGYFLLAEIVARASGMSMVKFAEKYIFKPLGMKNTHFHDNRNMIVRNRASGYSPAKGGFRINMTQLEMIGDGGIFTTIEDMYTWDQNFYKNMLGSEELMDVYLEKGKFNDGSPFSYAFGIRVDEYRGLRTIGHGGSFVGFRAANLQFPDHRFSVIILANTSAINPTNFCRRVADIYLENELSAPIETQSRRTRPRSLNKVVNLSVSDMKKFTGEFYSDELKVVYKIELIDNRLKFTHKNASNYFLRPVSEDEFAINGIRLKFLEKKRSGFEVYAGRVQHIKFNRIK